MYLLISGKIIYQTGGNSFFVRPGDILFINSLQQHCPILLDSDTTYNRIALHISPAVLHELSDDSIDLAECFTRDNYVVYHFPPDVQSTISFILGKLLALQQSTTLGHNILGRAYLTELFVEINQHNHDHSIFTLSDEMKENQLVTLIKQYVSERLEGKITIDELAAYACMSKSHFMYTFKRLTGVTAYRYILQQRLESACVLIRGGASFTTACQHCGFSDYSSFYRLFSRQYGFSPRVFFSQNSAKI